MRSMPNLGPERIVAGRARRLMRLAAFPYCRHRLSASRASRLSRTFAMPAGARLPKLPFCPVPASQ